MAQDRLPRGHSCVRCKKRKIKCDGAQPCAACTRAHATCMARPPAMPRRPQMKSATETKAPVNSRPVETPVEELLVEDEGNPRYVNNPLWGDLSKELPISLTTEKEIDSGRAQFQHGTSIFWGLSGYKSVQSCHPDIARIFKLWQTFLDNVHPVTKILHAPSVQRQVTEAASCLDLVSRNLEALMFAIYLTAVNSLNEHQCDLLLGESKSILLQRFLAATEQSLVNAKCLKSCSLVVLQALTLYLLCMHQYHDHQSAWLLTGLALRSGQRMGLHKETVLSGRISPFESEIRCRLWWQILALDFRAAQLSGFAMDMQTREHFEARCPLNVSDCELFPEMKELPLDVDSHGTEMLFCLMRYESSRFMASSRMTGDEIDKAVDEFILFAESKFIGFCDETVPLHLLTKLLAQCTIVQLRIKGLQGRQRINNNNKQQYILNSSDRNVLLNWNIEVIECTNKIYSTECLQPFLWFVHMLFPFESFVHVLMELQHGQDMDSLDHAWSAIDAVYNVFMGTDWLPCNNPNDLMYVAVGTMALKAWQTQAARRGATPMWVLALKEKQEHARRQRSSDASGEPAADLSRVDVEGQLFDSDPPSFIENLDINWGFWTQVLGQP